MLKEANISKTEYFKKVNITFQNKLNIKNALFKRHKIIMITMTIFN
jgi:hypothetical protein